MKQFDLFAGYGGFTIAGERCGLETIGFSEIDKYANSVLKYHYPNVKQYGDITKIDWSEVPDFNLLTGGSPCQDLSIAGKRMGLNGKRSGLFYEFMRAVNQKKPKYFIWENVKGALSSNSGHDFATVLNEMAEAGYSLWWQVLNAKDFGVPQNRERIFVVGFRDGSPREVFFEPRSGRQNGIANCLDSNYYKGFDNHGQRTGVAVPEATKTGYAVAEKGDSINLAVINSQTRRGRVGKGVAQTLDCGMQQHILTDCRIRRLTPTECERLMGLPDGWTAKGFFQKEYEEHCTGKFFNGGIADESDKERFFKEISDSQRYKLCGNGVVVNVVEEIIKTLIL